MNAPWIEQLRAANWQHAFGVSLIAYLLGCFATGYYLVRLRTGRDIRELGSCSVGAKNVGRILGKTGFILTALGDVAKGMLAIWVANHFAPGEMTIASLAMLAVIVGHVWPLQLWFRGGKGVATLIGALLIYDYHQAIVFLIVFACAFLLLRKTVLPGLLGVLALPFANFYFQHDSATTTIISFSVTLVLFTHRKNIVEEIIHLLPHHNEPHPEHPDL